MIPRDWRTDHDGTPPDHPSRTELADDNPGDGPRLEPGERLALVDGLRNLQAAVHEFNGCHGCGVRCDICGERMCNEYGPEPAITCAAHIECRHCHTDNKCADCRDERGAA